MRIKFFLRKLKNLWTRVFNFKFEGNRDVVYVIDRKQLQLHFKILTDPENYVNEVFKSENPFVEKLKVVFGSVI